MPQKNMGVNPARAGMILPDQDVIEVYAGKPRASGDDPSVFLVRHILHE